MQARSYSLLKANGYDKANSAFVLKGAHEGHADPEWSGSGTGTGGGNGGRDGGGSRTGTGTGSGGGNKPDKLACQSACKTKYPAAVDTWTAFNTCVTATCASSCL